VDLLQKSVKEKVLKVISEMPTNSSYEDVFEQILILRKIESALTDVQEGKTMPQEEVELYFQKKWQR
jgi:hypothetical protein